MNASTASRAYAKTGVESGVCGADPHKLISMLYQGAVLAIANGKNALLRKDVPAKGAAISKAIMIIDEGLLSSLDKNVGGELANNLASLYEYMSRRLLVANVKNDMEALDEVTRLLNDLKGAWDGIRSTVVPVAASSPASAPAAKAAQVYEIPVGAKPAPAKAVSAPVKAAPVAAAPQQAKTEPAAATTAPAKTADAPSALPPQQQLVVNKVQAMYGRM